MHESIFKVNGRVEGALMAAIAVRLHDGGEDAGGGMMKYGNSLVKESHCGRMTDAGGDRKKCNDAYQ